MKHFLLLLFGLLLTASIVAQDVSISYESRDNTVYVYAAHPHPCPVSVKINLKLTNMEAEDYTAGKVYVVPPNDGKTLLTTLQPKRRDRNSRYHLEYEAKYGDVTRIGHDVDHIYELPYAARKSVVMHQGYNGRYSHRGVNALDFQLNKGEAIHAARGGVVIDVEERNSKGCKSPSCHKYNNTIVIYHDDGSLAVYSHLQHMGSEVSVGDVVTAGQHIGYAGATGYASGPHLHFMVLRSRFGDNETIKTQFQTREKGTTYLQEHQSYTRP